MYTALENHMMKQYGCVAPFIVSNESVCSDYEKNLGSYKVAWNRVTNQAITHDSFYYAFPDSSKTSPYRWMTAPSPARPSWSP